MSWLLVRLAKNIMNYHTAAFHPFLITWALSDLFFRGYTYEDGSVDLVSVRLHLGVGHRVVVQHRLQVGPVGGQVGVQHPLHGLGRHTSRSAIKLPRWLSPTPKWQDPKRSSVSGWIIHHLCVVGVGRWKEYSSSVVSVMQHLKWFGWLGLFYVLGNFWFVSLWWMHLL